MVVFVCLGLAAPVRQLAEATGGGEERTFPMTVKRFDPDVARAHGYEIVPLADGRLRSVPIDGPAGVSGASQNVVNGDCGESWILLFDEVGTRGRYDIDTGFRVIGPAVDYKWMVHVEKAGAPRRNRNHPGGRPLNGRTAETLSIKGPSFGEGRHRATIVPTDSFVILANGAVCYSGGPSDEAYIYGD
jgi:hypothetical protein